MNARTQLTKLLIMIAFFSLTPFVLLFLYDPYQIFHKSLSSVERVFDNDMMRVQAVGLINNYAFDSMILGTSMLKGSSAKLATELSKEDYANLSVDGGTIYERSLILEYALARRELKSVIFSLDTGLDIHARVSPNRYPLKEFAFLYDSTPLNDLNYYWNKHHLLCMISWSNDPSCRGEVRSLHRGKEWFSMMFSENEKISGVEGWYAPDGRGKFIRKRLLRIMSPKNKERSAKKREYWRKIVDDEFLPLIENNSETVFKLVFPPYSRFLMSMWKKYDPHKYQDYQNMIRYFVDKSEVYSNIEVYAFDESEYVENLDNYRDLRHFNYDMNELIIRRVLSGRDILNVSNVSEYLEEQDRLIRNYNVDSQVDVIVQNVIKKN